MTRRKTPERIFDPKAFYREIEQCRHVRNMRWVDVQNATGVGLYTFGRLKQGNDISVNTYLALRRWMDEVYE
jgi:hypothetical protein